MLEVNNIILTAFENKCPLHSFSFLECRTAKNQMPELEMLNGKIT